MSRKETIAVKISDDERTIIEKLKSDYGFKNDSDYLRKMMHDSFFLLGVKDAEN